MGQVSYSYRCVPINAQGKGYNSSPGMAGCPRDVPPQAHVGLAFPGRGSPDRYFGVCGLLRCMLCRTAPCTLREEGASCLPNPNRDGIHDPNTTCGDRRRCRSGQKVEGASCQLWWCLLLEDLGWLCSWRVRGLACRVVAIKNRLLFLHRAGELRMVA
jgi:hypothetical protein